MLQQLFALLAIVCFYNSNTQAHAKGLWSGKDTPAREVDEIQEESGRFNPFFYALPNQIAEFLQITPNGPQETEYAFDFTVPRENVENQYESRARPPVNSRRKPYRMTTKKPKRKRPNKRPKATKGPLVPVKQHRIPKDPTPPRIENMPGMKEPAMMDYEYPPMGFEAGQFYPPPPPPPPLPPVSFSQPQYWPIAPYQTSMAAYYGYPPMTPLYEAQAQTETQPQPQSQPQSQPQPQPQPLAETNKPQLQLQIPTDQNTLQLLQLALVLQQTLATAAAVTAGSTNAATATSTTAAIEAPITEATAVMTSVVTPAVAAPMSEAAAVVTSLPAAVSSTTAAVLAANPIDPVVPMPTAQTPLQIVSTAASQVQEVVQAATTVASIVEMANPPAVVAPIVEMANSPASGNDDIVIGDDKSTANVDSSLKSIITPDVTASTETAKIEGEPMVEENNMSAEPAVEMTESSIPVLYVRVPVPAIKSPMKPMQDLVDEVEVKPSDNLKADKEIVATVPYYPRTDDDSMAGEYQVVATRYIKPIDYRPDSPDHFQSRRRGKSEVTRR